MSYLINLKMRKLIVGIVTGDGIGLPGEELSQSGTGTAGVTRFTGLFITPRNGESKSWMSISTFVAMRNKLEITKKRTSLVQISRIFQFIASNVTSFGHCIYNIDIINHR